MLFFCKIRVNSKIFKYLLIFSKTNKHKNQLETNWLLTVDGWEWGETLKRK